MTNEYWAHPTSEGVYVRPDGSTLLLESQWKLKVIDGAPVVSWPDHARIAAALAYDADKVITARGVVLDRKEAVKAGFKIDAADQSTPRSWRSSIMTSPEAKGRPAATAELLTSRTPETLTVDQARAFLRGLPVETEPTETPETMTTNTDPRAARLAEISGSMAAYNRSMGHRGKPKIAHQAAAPSNIEPAKLKRLAEIRLNALHMNGHGHTQEAKTLRLALDTHNTVGTPISRIFAQLGIDAAKFAS